MHCEFVKLGNQEHIELAKLETNVYDSLKLKKLLCEYPKDVGIFVSQVIAITTFEARRILKIERPARFKLQPQIKGMGQASTTVPHKGEREYAGTLRFGRKFLSRMAKEYALNKLRAKCLLQHTTAHEVYHLRESVLFPGRWTRDAFMKYEDSPWESDRGEYAAELFATKFVLSRLKSESAFNLHRYLFAIEILSDLAEMKKVRLEEGY